ncbi:MAG: hypothetical protein NC248_09210 [Bacteroides sp.]|nr:hypothetical protein [Bacteroides sp.]MCM1390159.1 hypothetical protein [Bacteroides sp.]
MASNSVISVSFKFADGENGLKKLTVDANELCKVMQAAVGISTKLEKSIINFGALATGIDSVSNTLSSWLGTLDGFTQLYSAQIEAETKLAVNMRNTMDAREEDIQSIKDLCSAQQQLGVIGDEVQLAGAQELATYRLEDIFDARSFCSPYTAPRLSPRGGAIIILPLHGIDPWSVSATATLPNCYAKITQRLAPHPLIYIINL